MRPQPHDGTASDARKRPKSALNLPQRIALALGLFLVLLMLANTLYLLVNRLADETGSAWLAVTEYSLPVFYQVMVLSHTGLGLVVAGLGALFVIWHLGTVWKRRKTRTVVSGLAALLALGGLTWTGLMIMTAAATRDNAWAWWTHVALAAALPLAYLLHRVWAIRKPTAASLRGFALGTVGATAALLAGHLALPRGPQLTPEAIAHRASGAEQLPGSLAHRMALLEAGYDGEKFVPAAHVPVESPFFPAAATTTTGGFLPQRLVLREHVDRKSPREDLDLHGFVVSDRIGADMCVRCHADVVEQWATSAHRFSSFNNPFYEASINLLRDSGNRENPLILGHMAHYEVDHERLPLVRSQWCSSCHDPALMIPGKMSYPIDRESIAAQAGLTCLACHNIDAIHNTTGNGNYNQVDEQESPYLFADAQGGILTFLHDTAIKARPAVHKRQMLKPFFRTSEFCSACHKVSLDVPVNSYRWFRGQNEYDNWHDSGIAHNASRTFYLPPNPRVCQDCHMPPEPAVHGDFAAKNGMVRSHRFIAVNNALPFIRGDTDTVRRVEEFLQDNKLSVDVFAVVQPPVDAAEDPFTVYGINHTEPVVPPGRPVRLEVVVRNRDVGHTFPGGTNDSNESWVEFTVLDADGQILTQSGFVREDKHVDPEAHFYRVVMVDQGGRRVFRRDPHNFLVPLYARVIGPGTADAVHFEFTPPPELAGTPLTVRARLMWRKFDRRFTEFAFHANREGFKGFDQPPDLPIVEIAADEVTITVGEVGLQRIVAKPLALPESEWTRMNDYGIGLLLEGNTRAAYYAFSKVAEIVPQRPDGFRNMARAARVEGNLVAAYEALRRAEAISPANAQTAWVWGQVLAEDGRYEEAAAAYRRCLQVFPNDRAAWRELTTLYYLNHQFEKSIQASDEVLKIDPEDRVAHYYRMLAFQALRRDSEAAVARVAYEKYQIDESAQARTQALRLEAHGDNIEAQAIHVHVLELGKDKLAARMAEPLGE